MTAKTPKSTGKDNKVDAPKVYAVTGTVQTSDFAIYQSKSEVIADVLKSAKTIKDIHDKIKPVLVRQAVSGVGTVSHKLSNEDLKKIQSGNGKPSALPAEPNIFRRDIASLYPGFDTVVITGTIKFVNNYAAPTMSSSAPYTDSHKEFVKAYVAKYGLTTLIQKHLANIYNNRILWRNQYGLPVGLFIRLRSVAIDRVFDEKEESLVELATLVAEQLEQKKVVILDVASAVIVGDSAEVFPSQPFTSKSDKADDKEKDDGKEKEDSAEDSAESDKSVQKSKDNPTKGKEDPPSIGRQLSTVTRESGEKQVILHSQKVGNALRCIDTWYDPDTPDAEPISVSVYGSVPPLREAHRITNNNYFYGYFTPAGFASVIEDESKAHYVMSMLIKGGVFNESSK